MNKNSIKISLVVLIILMLSITAYITVFHESNANDPLISDLLSIDAVKLAKLSSGSEAIVLGRITSVSNPKVLLRDSKQASADFLVYREATVKAETWYKKSNAISDDFIITLPGGEVVTGDTKLKNDILANLTKGEEAILFLNKAKLFNKYDLVIVNGNWEGIFHFADGTASSKELVNGVVMEVLTKDQISALKK